MKKQILFALCLLASLGAHAELRIPAFTAYLEPDPEGAEISRNSGIKNWTDPAEKVLWFGEIKTPGSLQCVVEVQLAANAETKLRLTVGTEAREVTAHGEADATKLDFGSFNIPAAGYQKFTLESLNASGASAGNIKALLLSGPASEDAHFNLKERRNAASVHLAYPTPGMTNVDAFYCEVTGEQTPLYSYFEACGWHRGYFGMQVNSPTERRIIFSVWDSGHEAVSRDKVGQDDRVTLVAKGPGVYSGDFGNEGTGGHSHFVYNWKTGEKQRFLVTAKTTDATHTIYAGYWFQPEEKKWMLISSWKTPKDGQYMHGLYSFNEDFAGGNGELRRKALFGNQWIHTVDGQWREQTTATFSHDPTGKTDRLDRFMGVENGQFFLSNGGFIAGFTKFGEKFERPPAGPAPLDFTFLTSMVN